MSLRMSWRRKLIQPNYVQRYTEVSTFHCKFLQTLCWLTFNFHFFSFAVSAFLGKCGALLATICFKYLTAPQIFFVCAATSFLGSLVSLVFSVDLTGVSLAEHDAQLELFLEGKVGEYKGKLNDPKHLSLYERLTERHGSHDPNWAHAFMKNMSRAVSHTSSN